MTIKQLVKELCRREGLKKSMDVAQVTELVGHLADLIFTEQSLQGPVSIPTIFKNLYELGKKRFKKKQKKVKK
jgi:hypothetical protein